MRPVNTEIKNFGFAVWVLVDFRDLALGIHGLHLINDVLFDVLAYNLVIFWSSCLHEEKYVIGHFSNIWNFTAFFATYDMLKLVVIIVCPDSQFSSMKHVAN
jgi:hypothetical protein